MFKLNPSLMQHYPFYKDEWNRIFYSDPDYNGTYTDQVSNSWFILFRLNLVIYAFICFSNKNNIRSIIINKKKSSKNLRDIFYAQEEVLLLPKLYCNLNNCLLKVINNDTYKEIPKVFNKVSPYTYAKK